MVMGGAQYPSPLHRTVPHSSGGRILSCWTVLGLSSSALLSWLGAHVTYANSIWPPTVITLYLNRGSIKGIGHGQGSTTPTRCSILNSHWHTPTFLLTRACRPFHLISMCCDPPNTPFGLSQPQPTSVACNKLPKPQLSFSIILNRLWISQFQILYQNPDSKIFTWH